MEQVNIVDHPLVQHKLTYLRKEDTPTRNFNELVTEITSLLTYQVTTDLKMKTIEIDTPLVRTNCDVIGERIVIVAILRAGLGMVEGVRSLIPQAEVGHLGLQRDEDTFEPVKYYFNIPDDIPNSRIIVVDPMLATGGTADASINLLKEKGAEGIRFMCIVAAPEGIERIRKNHPDVEIYTAAIDEKLNDDAYILPGLGDAGDRLFGTE